MCVAGFAVGFTYGWQLTLVILAVAVLIMLGGVGMMKSMRASAAKSQGFTADAAAIADEILRMMRTVIAFDTQDQVGKQRAVLCSFARLP
jgi:ABC-type multidrug transport system fused ATPase/permease subunit